MKTSRIRRSGPRVRMYTAGEEFLPSTSGADGEGAPLGRFHRHRGSNIDLRADSSVATRRCSFAKGIVFSERALEEKEIFLLEITDKESGWSGHLRLGLTTLDPNRRPELPLYALPDLNRTGSAWVYGLTERDTITYDGLNGSIVWPNNARSLITLLPSHDDGSSLGTNVSLFDPGLHNGRRRLPTDVGSRIGIFYRRRDGVDGRAQIFLLLNGILLGPLADIPLSDSLPLYALVDVYGTTKQVKIIPLSNQVEPLSMLCRSVIVGSMRVPYVDALPLPKPLRDFLRRQL